MELPDPEAAVRWWVVVLVGCAGREEPVDTGRQVEAFPRCAQSDPLRRPFFGDTHTHTALSLDANLQGTRLRPAEAYAFAKGEEVGIQPHDSAGNALRRLAIDRPLDFLVVSDHAEFLGAVALCTTEGSPAYASAECVRYREQPDLAFVTINAYTAAQPDSAGYPALCGDDGALCKDAGLDVWAEIQDAADAAYDRTDACGFTSFVGYEWSGGPGTKNLHRNVIFRHDTVPDVPVSYFDAARAEDLWDALDAGCLDDPPCDVLTIPHNSNLSGGTMFETHEDADPTAATAARRARMEPLVEVFQHKGASECLPGALGSDELCGFEVVPYASLSGANLDVEGDPLPHDFVRTVLGEGLRFEDGVGQNPYAWGLVASTDTHLGTGGAASEIGYPGHGGAGAGARDEVPTGLPDLVTFNPGGLAVLWAEENTREALFRAMRRKEAYGTSGPRIVLRFFGGWDYPTDLCDAVDLEAQGYDGGVPMGGTLEGSGTPRFVVAALADPGTSEAPGTPLQRLQVVKGWLDGDDVRTEVVDVAGSANGATVGPDCAPSGGGAARLCAVWTDPAFDPTAPAFYYVRAIEDPTCRWSARQCRAAGITCPASDPAWAGCCDDRVPDTIQERAWSSPIWYAPGG